SACCLLSRLRTFCLPPTTFLSSSPIAGPAHGSDCIRQQRRAATEYFTIIIRQGALIRSLQDQVEELQNQLQGASQAHPPPPVIAPAATVTPPPSHGESPRMVLLEKYDGSADRCRGFLCQCEIFFSHQPDTYREEEIKCAFLFLLLMGRALDWASVVWDVDPQIRTSFTYFMGMVHEVFEYPPGDNLHCQRRADSRPSLPTYAQAEPPSPRGDDPEPMQLRRSHVPDPVRQHLACNRLCFYFGGSGHLSHCCPDRPPDRFRAVNLIDKTLVEELRIATLPHTPPLKITAIDSQPIGKGYLTHQTELLELQVGVLLSETLAFYMTSSPANPIILGFPWLRQHDPQLSWMHKGLLQWSPRCVGKCLRNSIPRPCLTTSVENPNTATQQGVEMDQTKVCAVTEWPEPTTVRELQRFLGFANFYWRFIRNYSSIASPLTSLLKSKPRRLVWNEMAREAFVRLRTSFTTAPILHHPDPNLPFAVEIDASSSGIGAVLSQRHGTPGKLHPCAFYSRKLTVAKANYDMGNRELLSIKDALEEWCYWLEGARHPFLVLTDHRNLENLRDAKRLNLRQARWALFFTRFEFSVTYCPGSKNSKADALSLQFEADKPLPHPDPILPSTAILAPVWWNLLEEIQRAHANEPPPAN
ncbi:hypothetical protein QTP70_004361, partial [Hemibagrus guttatus]